MLGRVPADVQPEVRSNAARRKGWIFIVCLVGLIIGVALYQRHYIRKHLPLIAEGVAAADKEGPAIFEAVGLPSGSTPYSPMEKRYGTQGRRSMWRGVTSSITWTAEYEIPGEFLPICDWYRKRLFEQGWVSFDDTPPSTVQREFKRGKWFLKLGNRASFTHPTRTRLMIELSWRYFARTDI